MDEEEVEKEAVTIDWDAEAAEKAGYEHFMLKEMYEQPKTVADTLSPRIKGNDIVIEELGMSDAELLSIKKIHIVACGSAYHAGVTGKYVLEGLARIPVEVDLASGIPLQEPHSGGWCHGGGNQPVRERLRIPLPRFVSPRKEASKCWVS